MQNFITNLVKKPITVLMSMLIIIVLGVFSLSQMSMDIYPDVELPYMSVVTTYVGADPYEVENEVTVPIETILKGISGFESLTSESSENISVVTAVFNSSENMDKVKIELSENLSNYSFNEGVGKPISFQFDISMMPTQVLSLSRKDSTIEEDTIWLEEEILNELSRVSGVADVSITGESQNILSVSLSKEKLDLINQGLGLVETDDDYLTDEKVMSLLDRQLYAGESKMQITGDNELIIIRPDKISYSDPTELGNIFVLQGVQLKDLSSKIEIINSDTSNYYLINGEPAITVSFTKQSNQDSTTVSRNIDRKIDELKLQNSDMQVVKVMDQAEIISSSIGSVTSSLLWGAALAIIILILFLKDLRPTLVVSITIPISVIGTFILMYFSGINLNVISMGGLALGIGMLVDNSVVVIENIYRLLRQGVSKMEASIKGTTQVMGAIIASTLTTVSVFLPILVIDNMVITMIRDLSLTISYSLLASLIIAITLVPSLSSKLLKEEKKSSEGILKKLRDVYEVSVKKVLNYRILSLCLLFLIFAISIPLSSLKGFEIFPAEDSTNMEIDITMQKNTSIDKTKSLLGHIDNMLEEDFSNVINVRTTQIGSGGFSMISGGFVSTDVGNISIEFNSSKDLEDYRDKVIKQIDEINYDNVSGVNESDVDEYKYTDSSGVMGTGLDTTDINIQLSGLDDVELRRISSELIKEIEIIDGVSELNNGIPELGEEVIIKIDEEKAINAGYYRDEISKSYELFNDLMFNSFLSSGVSSTTVVIINGKEYDVVNPDTGVDFTEISQILSNPNFDPTKEDFGLGLDPINDQMVINLIQFYMFLSIDADKSLLTVPIMSLDTINVINAANEGDYYSKYNHITNEIEIINTTTSQKIDSNANLGDVSELTLQGRTAQIRRNENGRYINITGIIEDQSKSSAINNKISEILENYELPSGYKAVIGGTNADFGDLLFEVSMAMIVAILLVYMIMAIQFQNLIFPLIVLVTIPLAFTGGLLAIWITGSKLSIVAMIGLIILVGIVINNGIVLIDYINKLITEKGLGLYEAIIEAGKTRMRPILMTTLTTVFGLLVMALGIGDGTTTMRPMAITAIGGLLYSTILTLIFIPIVYSLIVDFKRKKLKVFNKNNDAKK